MVIVFYHTAHRFWERFKGVMGKKENFTPVFFPHCQSVHTFFVLQPIHLVWVDKDGRILSIDKNVPGRRIRTNRQAFGVLEFPEKYSLLSLTVGTKIQRIENKKRTQKFTFSKTSITQEESGQVLVEAAFMLPVLLFIVFGFVQLGLAITELQKLTHVVNYATQVGSITNDNRQISGAVEEFYNPTNITVAVESKRHGTQTVINDTDRRYQDVITVQLQYPFNIQVPFFSVSIINLQTQASARVLCQSDNPPYHCN